MNISNHKLIIISIDLEDFANYGYFNIDDVFLDYLSEYFWEGNVPKGESLKIISWYIVGAEFQTVNISITFEIEEI